jgi:hypothetical protein
MDFTRARTARREGTMLSKVATWMVLVIVLVGSTACFVPPTDPSPMPAVRAQ